MYVCFSPVSVLRGRRYTLDNVQLPSDHWEWVGGWMVDSETEACADDDGWVYGWNPSEISDIAEGRKRPDATARAGVGNTAAAEPAEDETSARGAVGEDATFEDALPRTVASGGDKEATTGPDSAGGQEGSEVDASGSCCSINSGGASREEGGRKSVADGASILPGTDVGGQRTRADGGAVLRRRRLVRLRMVTRVDGARESTTKFLETLQR